MEHQPTRRDRSAHFLRWRRWDAVALLVPVVILLIIAGMLVATHFGMQYEYALGREKGFPPPDLFRWEGQATLNSTTPQEAYAAAMDLTPCVGPPTAVPGLPEPARSTTVTWLVATTTYGLATVQAVCDPPARSFHRFLLQLYRFPAGDWEPRGGYIASNWGANPTAAPPAPTWLSLPADTYDYNLVDQPGIGDPIEVSVVDWDAQKRLFVFGHIADRVIRSDGATSVIGDGLPGWMTAENGLVTVTVVRADGTTLFFSGTATPTEVQALAAQAFAHVNDALQPLHTPATTQSAPATP